MASWLEVPMIARLADRVAMLSTGAPRTVLGITGCPGAGKSTLAEHLVHRLNEASLASAYVPMDGFHLADAALDRLGRRERKGAIDTFDGHGYLAMLRRFHAERSNTVYAPGFDRSIEQPIAATVAVDPGVEIIVTEGNYLLDDEEPWRHVRNELTEVWYCELAPAARLERLIARHERFGKSAEQAREWVGRVDEPNARRIERTRDRADLVIDMHALPVP